jgi:hypothetical protein
LEPLLGHSNGTNCGVPATVEIRNEVRDAVKLLHAYRDDLKDSEDNTIDMVKAAIKKKFTESGNITATCHRMEEKSPRHHGSI